MKIALLTVVCLFSLSSFFSLPSFADELHLPKEILQAMGYIPQRPFVKGVGAFIPEPPLNLPWPVVFQDAAHTVAQDYVNYQNYGDNDAYFHKGCDLRSKGDSDVTAPVTGILEGGYYGYTDHPDGSEDKQWQPWNGQTHADPYFELALTTDDGYRFEFHHVDSQKLPQNTLDALNKGHVRIQSGTVIGKVNAWAFDSYDYDHVHYNIFRPDGVAVNPEYYSKPLPAHTPPAIHGVYAIGVDHSAIELVQHQIADANTNEIVVAATESHDGDAYVQTPVFVQIRFKSGAAFAWDFRKKLQGPDGKFPDIRLLFADSVTPIGGDSIDTYGQYGKGMFLFRLPVQAKGEFELTVGDSAGNESHFTASINR